VIIISEYFKLNLNLIRCLTLISVALDLILNRIYDLPSYTGFVRNWTIVKL